MKVLQELGIVFIFAYKLKNMKTMNEQKTAEEKLLELMDWARQREKEEWQNLRRIEDVLGTECTEYKQQTARWSQWYDVAKHITIDINL